MLRKINNTLNFGKGSIPYILLLPLLVLYILPLCISMFLILVQSLGIIPSLGLNEVTFSYYMKAFYDETFGSAFAFSMICSTMCSIIAVTLGFFMALILSNNKKKGMLQDLLQIPLLIPHFTAAFMVFLLLSQSGIVSRAMGSLNIISNQSFFPQLVLDKFGFGIMITYIWKEIPFCALVILASMKSIDDRLKLVSKNLGASQFQYLKYVLLPLCLPTMLNTFIIIFAYNFGAFEVPYLLGPTYPKTMSVLSYISYSSPDILVRPYTMALNVIITFMSILLIFIYVKTLDSIKALEGQIAAGRN